MLEEEYMKIIEEATINSHNALLVGDYDLSNKFNVIVAEAQGKLSEVKVE